MTESQLEAPAKEKNSVIIPGKALLEMDRLLKTEGEARIAFSGKQILFLMDELLITSALIDGQFPNYEQVIPKKSDKKIAVGTQEFLRAIRRASVFSMDKAASIRLEAQKGKLTVASSAPELGEAKEEISAKYDGESIIAVYNARFIQDVLKAVTETEIVLELSEPLNPVLLRPQGNDRYLCVIMPMRI
jgi:DNA polymerase-3 subunit beta